MKKNINLCRNCYELLMLLGYLFIEGVCYKIDELNVEVVCGDECFFNK